MRIASGSMIDSEENFGMFLHALEDDAKPVVLTA